MELIQIAQTILVPTIALNNAIGYESVERL